MLEVVQDKQVWNKFVLDHAPRSGAFLQSWQWGALYQSNGYAVTRFKTDTAAAQALWHPLLLGRGYFYLPRGPLGENAEAEKNLLRLLEQRVRHALFVRYEAAHEGLVKTWAFKTREVQPLHTWVTDLSVSSDVLLASLHQKTRYNVRLAERKGVEVKMGTDAFIEDFVRLMRETARRDRFHAHPPSHYRAMLQKLDGKDGGPKAGIAVAVLGTEVLAANLFVDWVGTRTYVHGCSASVHRDLMAPHLLHWRVLEEAKAIGLHRYDWWGIAPEGQERRHPLEGVTRFKRGFPGERIVMPRTMDAVFHPVWYVMYRVLRKVRGL